MAVAIAALALLVTGPPALATLPPPGSAGSHEAYSRHVKSAELRALQDALEAYDAHLRKHPADAMAAVERCKLIAAEMASHDDEESGPSDDGETPTHGGCLEGLAHDFPESVLAVRYRLDYKWSNDAIAFGKEALANPRIAWTNGDLAAVYVKLSRSYSASHQLALASHYARLAMDLEPSLDMTREVASQLIAEGRRTEAVVVLSSRTDGPAFELAHKARMLADAGAFARGAWMLDLAAGKGKTAVDAMLRARILERTGKLQLARKTYAEQGAAWNRLEVLTRIFEIDLAGSDPASAARSYHDLRELGWKTDPLGRRRLALAWKFPGAGWRPRDLSGVLALLGCLAGLALLPGLLLVPLHSWWLRRRLRAGTGEEPPPTWGFRHAWLATAAMLVCQFLAVYVFAYDDLTSWFAAGGQHGSPPRALAAFALFYALLLTASFAALVVRRRERLRLLGPGTWSLPKSAGQAVLGLLVAFAVAVASHLLFKLPGKIPLAPGATAIESMVKATVDVYGPGLALLVFALLIPIAEELIFRSILLDVFGRQMRFWLANAVQALLFATLHGDPSRLPFYFVFGLMTGRMRRASGGLLPGILMHAANNAIVVAMLAAVGADGLPRKMPALSPDAELAACATSSRDSQLQAAAGKLSGGNADPWLLNNVAWALAIEPTTSRACLLRAEQAVDEALRWLPERPSVLDTKATVWFRQGRLNEAIDLERGASALSGGSLHFSQLDRFLRARQAGADPILLGSAASSPKIAFEPRDASTQRSIVVETGGAFEDGLEIYARVAGPGGEIGLLQVAAGALHTGSYRFQVPKRLIELPDDVRLEVALVDARGCGSCSGGGWRWRLERHDRLVDSYP